MPQFQYGYLVKAPGYSLDKNKTQLESDAFKSQIVGVGSIEEACQAAKELVASGVTLLELCSGFKKGDAKNIHDAVEGRIKVGFIGEFFDKQ
ncbi:DUF6506 family protein [Desulfopila sp. IMCC35008]|uniref:DUF6506 family protein n=1 Tax=Desulfopila sp. IMCC35008 TaxID=2653858 RepID=UPI00197AB997|nr:DUF6506 family protein [Desulfopila sp. IMCC35008]